MQQHSALPPHETRLEQAKESLRIIQNRYQAGLTTVTELLHAQTAELDATTGYLAALQDWQVAQANWRARLAC